ncbi:MAG: PEP-CTERM/exosortase system-associated acyltransferase [Gammaproteobacteria bacterium]|jgi:N-acyl amino acid synthase of PEP-CTERM/exosortase system|nr:PEP-CTERM/exosortase system-associated acyltransferase [Gammaproteobacteria bacterium]
MNDLKSAFSHYFEVVPAATPELLDEVFRLRYQVYCHEIHLPDFEEWRYPDGRERDEFDPHSVHCMLRHRPTLAVAGAVRLVLPNPEDAALPFPLEEFAGNRIDVDLMRDLPRETTAEISRLILSARFRQRKDERSSRFGNDLNIREGRGREGRPTFPHPVLGLMAAALRLTAERNVTHWLAGMEPGLNRLLSRFGLDLLPIGPVVEYHGKRRPYLGVVSDINAKAYHKHRDIWDLLTEGGRLYPPPEN